MLINLLVVEMKTQSALCIAVTAFLIACAGATANQPAYSSEETEVRQVIQDYIDGTYEGDTVLLAATFHPSAVMNGYVGDQLMMGSPKPFIDNVGKKPLKTAETNYSAEILGIAVKGRVAAVELKESGFHGNATFTNFFHLIHDGSRWTIVSKTFYGAKQN